MKIKILISAIVLAATVIACSKQGADKAADTGTEPVAVVNGKPITRNTFDYYVKGVTGKPVAEATAEQQQQLLDTLVRGMLVAEKAEKDGLNKAGETQAMLDLTRLNVLQQAASQAFLKDRKTTDEELRAEYDSQLANVPKTEYHARHILVATEERAKKLISDLEKGGRFEELAKKESMDPSKTNGGDLGWFTPDRMVPAFSAAVEGLTKGTYTKAPVQTQYGWHIIRLDETRAVAAPPFDSVKDRLVQIVEAKKFKAYADDLVKGAKVDKKL